jgi:hypothetical protein
VCGRDWTVGVLDLAQMDAQRVEQLKETGNKALVVDKDFAAAEGGLPCEGCGWKRGCLCVCWWLQRVVGVVNSPIHRFGCSAALYTQALEYVGLF